MLTLINKKKHLALLAGAALSISASAAPDEGFQFLAGLGYFHDDNLFRLPDDWPAFGQQRGDSARTAQIGLLFDRRYSLQTFSAHAKLSRVKFNRFQQLDYDGKDGRFNWNWQLGSHLDGNIGATYLQMLAPYTDFRSDQRNLRVQRRQYADGGWRMHPSWRVRAGFARDTYRYDLPLQSINNRKEDTAEAGFDYLPKSGSQVGLVARRIRGRFEHGSLFGVSRTEDNFDQDELKARVLWLASGSTVVQGLAGYARRSYPAPNGHASSSGFNGRVTATHEPRGKLRYTAAVWREFAPIESNVVAYSLNKGASLGAGYAATGKLRVDANFSYEKRGYNARAALNQVQDLDDSLRTRQLSATWNARRTLDVTAAYTRQARSGSPFLGLGSFRANTVSLNANLRF